MRDPDDEPTVRVKRSSVTRFPVAERPSAFPDGELLVSQVRSHDRAWRGEIASAQRDIEELRAQVRALLEENKSLRTVLGDLRGR